jgi:hypothetical protein
MASDKMYILSPCRRWTKRFVLILFLSITSIFCNLCINKHSYALFTPTLSASIDNFSSSVNGNQVINSTDRTTEIPLRLTVNTTNRTGYTATISSSSENTALTNSSPSASDKINSISSAAALNSLPNNTWGYKVASEANYNPIPSLNSPATFLQTTTKTNGSESNNLSFGMKLSSSLESGSYENTLIITVVSNPYEQQAIINDHLHGDIGWVSIRSVGYGLVEMYNNIHHIKWCPSLDPSKISTYKRIDSDESDYPVYLWMDFDNSTLYFCSESNKVYFNKDSKEAFSRLEELEDIDLSYFSTEKVENMHGMFAHVKKIASLDLSGFNTKNVTNMGGLFSNMESLKQLNLSSFNTSNVKNMNEMFYGVRGINTLDLSNLDTSSVTDMSSMFADVENVSELNLSNFNTSKVYDMNHMFSGMKKLERITFGSNFDTSKVNDMSLMFSRLPKLKSLDLSNFDTSNVTDMGGMFSYDVMLNDLKLGPNFTSENVTDMSYMFAGVCELGSIDLSTFNTPKLRRVHDMFALIDEDKQLATCPNGDKLQKIYVLNDFNITKVRQSDDIFMGREKLRGGAGSFLADPSTADKSWLRIDDPANGHPGYFTRKP